MYSFLAHCPFKPTSYWLGPFGTLPTYFLVFLCLKSEKYVFFTSVLKNHGYLHITLQKRCFCSILLISKLYPKGKNKQTYAAISLLMFNILKHE
jgi:hypothetical protein